MDFSPLNIRMVVPHTNDVGEMQNNMNQHGAMLQNYRTNKDREQQEVRLKQIKKKEEAEGRRVEGDPDREDGRGRKRRKGKSADERHKELVAALGVDDDEEQEVMAVDHIRGRHLDISG